jgi:hypothetical protein
VHERLRDLSLKYEIQQTLAQRLLRLQDYRIILLCDDSGSMKTPVNNSSRSRWDELHDFVQIILEIGVIFDANGVDVHFLNRPPILNVTDPEVVKHVFSKPPRGYTPIVTALRQIFQSPATRVGHGKKALVFIATDGAPTDENGRVNVDELEHLMVHERLSETTYVMFLVSTDDPTCVDYLAQWDQNMINVDVTGNFRAEREKIRRYRGANYPFSNGDYIVKALLGAVDSEIDGLNEPAPVDSPRKK